MTLSDLIKRASPEERKLITEACIAAQNNRKPKAPSDAKGATVFWNAYKMAGGNIAPKQSAPQPKPRPGDEEIIIMSGPYQIRRKGGKPTPPEILRATLSDKQGRLLVEHIISTIDNHLAISDTNKIGIQYAIEAARWSWAGAGMKGEFKVDNDIASALARWAVYCWPDKYRDRIEVRGAQSPARSWPWINPDRPYEPRWTGAAGTPVPSEWNPIIF